MIPIELFPDPKIEYDLANVYRPSDDTYLIIDYLKENINEHFFDGLDIRRIKNILDMGTGTGIIAIFLEMIKKEVANFSPKIYASDILKEAIQCAKLNESINISEKNITFMQSDLFRNYPDNLKKKFNVIIFNPPYLPSLRFNGNPIAKKEIDYSWNGGEKGYELIIEFLSQVKSFLDLTQDFYIYYIGSSVGNFQNLIDQVKHYGFRNTILGKKHYFFEDITLNRLEKR